MKKILNLLLFFMFFFVLFAFTACDTDNKSNDGDSDVVGTWTGNMDCEEGNSDYWSEYWTLKLKSNGNFTLDAEEEQSGDNYYLYGSYSYDSDSDRVRIVIKGDDEGDLEESEFQRVIFSCTVSGDKMKLRCSMDDLYMSGTLYRK